MPSAKELKQRIKGIKSTGKITRAMEMISAVKMRKAVGKAIAMRAYAKASTDIARRLAQDAPLQAKAKSFSPEQEKGLLFVVITSQRGLCGSFNANVMRAVKNEMQASKLSVLPNFLSLGKKGDSLLRRFDGMITASFPEASAAPSRESVRPIAKMVHEEFGSGKYARVTLVFTEYVSPMTQRTQARTLLPFSPEEESARDFAHSSRDQKPRRFAPESLVEPNATEVLASLSRHMIEVSILHALFESDASQEAARMMAMRNATDAAKEMVADFTLSYNQLRQAKVTQEIAELSAGMTDARG